LFHQAADLISDPQFRNRGTIGGSLTATEPRCPRNSLSQTQ
jgi:CO/xanthine dehydrogenase FAD-binding subunit